MIKTYVGLGLGVGILVSMAFDPVKDKDVSLLKSDHLFDTNTTFIAVRRGHYLRNFAYRFIELCSPTLTEKHIQEVCKSAFDVH